MIKDRSQILLFINFLGVMLTFNISYKGFSNLKAYYEKTKNYF